MNTNELNERILSARRHYGDIALLEENTPDDPFKQFTSWLEDALNNNVDPCAMVLATIDDSGCPDTRIVLLLGLKENKLLFYTSYLGVKAQQIEKNNKAALNFYWPYKARQIRVKGYIEKVARQESEKYFSTRDRGGQLATHGNIQSSIIKDRAALVNSFKDIEQQFEGQDVPCPETWGGYQFVPTHFEFFQGRDHRLHDRIAYSLTNNEWRKFRLTP